MENPTSTLGETTGSKSFMAMTAAEKENFKNAMGNIFQQNPSIQPKIVTPAPAKNSANNNPSVLSSAKMENSTSILGETTGSKSFMAMTATEKEIFKNAMGNIFLKNLPIQQTTVIPVPITKESSKTKPSDQGEHRRKFVDVLNQIKLNNPVAQSIHANRTREDPQKLHYMFQKKAVEKLKTYNGNVEETKSEFKFVAESYESIKQDDKKNTGRKRIGR